jgi:hypothetical protein
MHHFKNGFLTVRSSLSTGIWNEAGFAFQFSPPPPSSPPFPLPPPQEKEKSNWVKKYQAFILLLKLNWIEIPFTTCQLSPRLLPFHLSKSFFSLLCRNRLWCLFYAYSPDMCNCAWQNLLKAWRLVILSCLRGGGGGTYQSSDIMTCHVLSSELTVLLRHRSRAVCQYLFCMILNPNPYQGVWGNKSNCSNNKSEVRGGILYVSYAKFKKNIFVAEFVLIDCVLKPVGVTKRCRLPWLTNSALVYKPKCWGRGELRGLSQWVQLCTWSPNTLWRSNSRFNLWLKPTIKKSYVSCVSGVLFFSIESI